MDPKVKRAYEAIKKLTDEKKLDWKGLAPNKFNPLITNIGDTEIRLSNSGSSVSFDIFKGGKRIGRLAEPMANGPLMLGGFWRMVERQAQGIDDALDSLLKDLGEI